MGDTLKSLNNVLKENMFDEKPFKSTYLFSNWKDLVGVMTQRKRKKERNWNRLEGRKNLERASSNIWSFNFYFVHFFSAFVLSLLCFPSLSRAPLSLSRAVELGRARNLFELRVLHLWSHDIGKLILQPFKLETNFEPLASLAAKQI